MRDRLLQWQKLAVHVQCTCCLCSALVDSNVDDRLVYSLRLLTTNLRLLLQSCSDVVINCY